MRFRTLLLALPLALSAAEVEKLSVPTPDGPREVLAAVPTGPRKPGRPLVLLFHGHGGNARHTLGLGAVKGSPLAAWLAVADREGIVVVALDGAKGADGKQGWNDGRAGRSGNPATDDVAYVRAALAALQERFATDPSRTYAMGMSNGGVFTFRLALELDPPLAAIAATCASMPGERPPAQPPRPLSVLLIEGTKDPLMPYGGGQVHFYKQLRGAVLGTEATLAVWRGAGRLTGPAAVQDLPHRDPKDPTRVTRLTWGRTGGPQVSLLKVMGGGHCEPSLSQHYGLIYTQICGAQNHDLEGAEEAWAFFRDKKSN